MSSILPFLLLILPFIGAAIVPFIREARIARVFALLVAFLAFALTLLASLRVDDAQPVRFDADWLTLDSIGFGLKLAVDGVSMWLLLLTTGITPLVILSTGRDIDEQSNARWYYTWILVLLGAVVGTFLANDGLLFYFFFELTLV